MNTRHMTLREPALRWQDALPCGNGRIGAMVYGHIRHETVLFNHEMLWRPVSKPELPSVAEHVPRLRQLLEQGRYKEANSFLADRMSDAGYRPPGIPPFLPAFNLEIESFTQNASTGYRRSLDFETGEATVSWRDGDAPQHRRLFVSRTDDAVVLSLPKAYSCRLRLAAQGAAIRHGMDWGEDTAVRDAGLRWSSNAEAGEGSQHWLEFQGVYQEALAFCGVARVVGAAVRVDERWLHLEAGERDALVLLRLEVTPGMPAEPIAAQLRRGLAALETDYEELLSRHAAVHGELFNRLRLEIAAPEERALSNEELLWRASDGEVPVTLIERLHDFGRYLLISSAGQWPPNLQGVWNGDYRPAWDSDYHNDENIQMNMWAALPGGLPEMCEGYFRYYETFLEDYRANACNVYGCRGILAPICQSTHGLICSGEWLNWTAGAGWLAQLFFEYWRFTNDDAFLRRHAVPFGREVALFYEDFCTMGEDGYLHFAPSLSPENVPRGAGGLCVRDATMDVAVAREVLTNLIAACERLDTEVESLPRWRELLRCLPPYRINDEGALSEWLPPELEDNYEHRHVSHLYPVFPGDEIDAEGDPALFQAARIAARKRMVVGLNEQTGWSLAHLACQEARLGNGERSWECLELLARSCVGPNGLTYHNDPRGQGITMYWGYGRPPFQIDANFGLTAAVLEMLVFSRPGLIRLLPALPSQLRRGRVTGLHCRGSVVADMEWSETRLQARLVAKRAQTVRVRLPAGFTAGGQTELDLELGAGQTVQITATSDN